MLKWLQVYECTQCKTQNTHKTIGTVASKGHNNLWDRQSIKFLPDAFRELSFYSHFKSIDLVRPAQPPACHVSPFRDS